MNILKSIMEIIVKIKDLVKNSEWQSLRKSFEGTWNKTPQDNCIKLRKYLGDFKNENKLRIVMNYLTGTGFRTGRIKHKCISKLRMDISKHLKQLKNPNKTIENYIEKLNDY